MGISGRTWRISRRTCCLRCSRNTINLFNEASLRIFLNFWTPYNFLPTIWDYCQLICVNWFLHRNIDLTTPKTLTANGIFFDKHVLISFQFGTCFRRMSFPLFVNPNYIVDIWYIRSLRGDNKGNRYEFSKSFSWIKKNDCLFINKIQIIPHRLSSPSCLWSFHGHCVQI